VGENTTGRAGCRAVPLGELTYAVLDLETTGLKPEDNGITEVCCLRVRDGQVVDRFATLVNPGRPIPFFVQTMTGITDDMVRGAPRFGEIIPSLLDFLGDSVLVAHHAPFDLSFLNYGLYTHGHRNLCNPVVDTLRLARKLLPDLKRGSLDAVVQHLGITVRGRHRASGDAEATAEVLLRLLSRCMEQGIKDDVQLAAFLSLRRPEKRVRSLATKAERAKLEVLAERCRAFPDAPGVYLMRSSAGRVLYVGKAVSLRKRLASYFNGRIPAKTRRMLRQAETIEQIQLGSELEALLEESRLIKHHQPPFNVLLRSYRNFPFVKVDESGLYPCLAVTRELRDDGAIYFGPFKRRLGTEQAVDILSRCFRLYPGPCPDRTAGEGCLYRQMGRCLAPCLGTEARLRHRDALEEVCVLLQTRPDQLLAELVRRRDAAADRLDFETAALYRDGIQALGTAVERKRLLDPAIEGLNVLAVCPSVHPGWVELFVFGQGRLVDRARLYARGGEVERASVEGLLRRVAVAWSRVEGQPIFRMDAESLDQVNIIATWLDGQGVGATTIPLEPDWMDQRFEEVAGRVIEAAKLAVGRAEP